MSGRSEVLRLKARLDATFDRVGRVQDDEVRADLARYLCVLVCGWLERAVFELLMQYMRHHASREAQRYVGWRLAVGFQNPSKDKIVGTLGGFNPRWGEEIGAFIGDARAAALGSLLAQRNRIAHGESSDISYVRVKDYYAEVARVVERVALLLES